RGTAVRSLRRWLARSRPCCGRLHDRIGGVDELVEEPRRGGGGGTILLALGVALAGWFVSSGLTGIRTADRFVTVKGVSEREVKADLALWPIQLAVTDDNVSIAQSRVNQNVSKVIAFLKANGIDSTEIELQGLRVTDVLANAYNQQNRAGEPVHHPADRDGPLRQPGSGARDEPESGGAREHGRGPLLGTGMGSRWA